MLHRAAHAKLAPHSDDFEPRTAVRSLTCLADADATPNGATATEHLVDETLVDDDAVRVAGEVARMKRPPGKHGRPEHAEVGRVDPGESDLVDRGCQAGGTTELISDFGMPRARQIIDERHAPHSGLGTDSLTE